ncbi:MAG: 5-formyltetrahydrofolate cyclo-ligase [Desulfobacterales bacterium]
MEDVSDAKQAIREEIGGKLAAMPAEEFQAKIEIIRNRLFEFANFLEAKIVLLYVDGPGEIQSQEIIQRSYEHGKIVVLPAFRPEKHTVLLWKVDQPAKDLIPGPRGVKEPNPKKCKKVPIKCIDIAIIPGIAFDEKGGRIGTGRGYYDRLMPRLPITTRKVALTMEAQMVPQIPMESHDRYVDIVITEKRVIYKI